MSAEYQPFESTPITILKPIIYQPQHIETEVVKHVKIYVSLAYQSVNKGLRVGGAVIFVCVKKPKLRRIRIS